jgi:sugar phosphate isomerase/epimerase
MRKIDRRSLLLGMGATTAASMFAASGARASARPFFARVGLPLGLQLYMLGDEAGHDLDATFAGVAAIGYREVELPNLLGRQASEIGAAAARAGLAIGSLHLPLINNGLAGLSLGSEPARIADTLGALGARWAIAPILLFPSGVRPDRGESFGSAISRSVAGAGEDIWKRSAALLNEKASLLRPFGIRLGYHNHNIEFAPVGQTTGWDILFRETEPGLVSFEVDIGWVAAAGLDPVAFLERARGRVKLFHVKDVAQGSAANFRIAMDSIEVGAGTLDWARILPAAHRAGARHFYVEQEPPFAIARIEAARRSFEFLSRLRA